MYWKKRSKRRNPGARSGQRRRRLVMEQLEQRTLLSISAMIDDPGFLAPPQSQEYLGALIRFRERIGWPVEEPRLLQNGNWYLGPAGDMSNVTMICQ